MTDADLDKIEGDSFLSPGQAVGMFADEMAGQVRILVAEVRRLRAFTKRIARGPCRCLCGNERRDACEARKVLDGVGG